MKKLPFLLQFSIVLFISSITFNVFAQDSGYTTSKDVSIHYRVYGNGYPIALLSGGPGVSSSALMPIVEELKDSFQVILIDQRGTGKSLLKEVNEQTITLDNYVEDINNVRLALGIDEWIVLGHSWGGGLAMAVTAKYPGNISGLIVIGSLGIDLHYTKYLADNLRYDQEDLDNINFWQDSIIKAKNPERAAYETYRSLLPSRLYNKADMRKIMMNFKYEPQGALVAPIMYGHLSKINYDLKPALKIYQKPTLIIQGRQGFLGGETALRIHRTIPNSQIAYIERCGHFPFIEQPDAFFKTLKTFLKKWKDD
ncbi:alpha/beta hydrolase [Leptobacterium sp. I13]|uniref:alpha/beta fold hydrolase n=1 Tax=Leptobacterium meishanense TaxID=3128904 RepID=UPI0030EF40FD